MNIPTGDNVWIKIRDDVDYSVDEVNFTVDYLELNITDTRSVEVRSLDGDRPFLRRMLF